MRASRLLLAAALATALCGEAAAQSKTRKPKPPDRKIVSEVFACLKPGLPADWKKAWVVMTETKNRDGEREFDLKYFYAVAADDNTGLPMDASCSDEEVGKRIYGLNQNLSSFEQRQWVVAKLFFGKDGKFELKYDYTR